MQSDYRISAGHGVAYASLVLIDPQPRSESRVEAAQREYGVDASMYEAGLHIVLQYSALDIEDYAALLEQFGLNSFVTRPITGWYPDHAGIYRRYDGIAYRPPNPKREWWLKDIRLTVSRLELIG